jgi:hypothetical protein
LDVDSISKMKKITTRNNTKSLFPIIYYEIFALRIMGLTYKQIASKIGYSEDHIKHLFYSKGVLRELLQSWLETTKKENIDEAINMMYGHLPDIMRTTIINARTPNSMIGIMAAKIIFEYTLGKPGRLIKNESKAEVFTFTDWIKQTTLEEKAEEQDKD